MKKIFVIVVAVMVTFVMAGSALAVGSGKTLTFEDGKMGNVTFDGTAHAKAGLKCNDCHPKIFKMKKGSDKMTMKDINEGKFCGECHNGSKAFASKEAANCAKCHKK